mmetsp:Transcript_5808/g.16451  ORF Transcript_5808/g.16451 Transcript_5808/m.16451 type:complete len:717 (-) Transcript_5808:101-2251(-)
MAEKRSGATSFSARLWKVTVEVNRVVTVIAYPVGLPFCCFNFSAPTAENARRFWQFVLAAWLLVTSVFYWNIAQVTLGSWRVVVHGFWFMGWDAAMLAFALCSFLAERLYLRESCTSRLFSSRVPPKFHGDKVVILGNGPSLVKGRKMGDIIDSMDEVVRFNNFQTKKVGLSAWAGNKTTVHVSDSMLYPSYPEYRVPGACVVLSLFMDRLMVSGSYFLFRMVIDLAPREAFRMMFDPSLGWISNEDISNLKENLGISKWKHPTSGCLALDWFVRHRPNPSVPVTIHGFDFFQGDQVHYYSKVEPLYERINDLLGVTMMHEPEKERAFVDRLVKEGKVRWLESFAPTDDAALQVREPDHEELNVVEDQRASTESHSEPLTSTLWKCVVKVNRTLTILAYPIALPFVCFNFAPATSANARFFWQTLTAIWLPVTLVFHYCLYISTWSWTSTLVVRFFWLWSVDVALFWPVLSFYLADRMLTRPPSANRLFNTEKSPEFAGSKIVVLGNGPSLAKGDAYGKVIDSMDEVVRFNNFQTKACGFEAWTGSKTTVHFSDSMLYPSYPEYKVPGTCVVLSLFMDRLMICISYFCFRMGIDLAVREAWTMMSDPALGWVSREEIESLKVTLGISRWKHPTSGCLAIDWFVRHRPDPTVPVYIHGFDFFQGDQVHYYSKTEPLYERLNDLLGVTMMHEPQKERSFVDSLVREGKVQWLRDLAHD